MVLVVYIKNLRQGTVLQEKAAPKKKKNPSVLCKIGNACAENVLAGVFVFALNAFNRNVLY